jgi:hypothetical protein
MPELQSENLNISTYEMLQFLLLQKIILFQKKIIETTITKDLIDY